MTDQPEKFDLSSDDVAARKRAELKRLYPEVFTEDKIDFDQLRRAMGDWVDPGPERFGLNWPGKAACMRVIQAPATGTLRPDRDESVSFDETENVFIEGDNLEVLKLMQKAYFGKVKMIYIDPPYNTGEEFIYPDRYAENLDTYLEYTGQKDAEGRRFSTNTDASGRFHSNWLNMMYPRIYLAKNLLRDDGVIFISIDDNESPNLVSAMNTIFGQENFVAQMVWEGAFKNDARQIGVNHEYVLVYAKDRSNLDKAWNVRKMDVDKVLKEVARLKREHTDLEIASSDLAGWFRANKAKPVHAHRRFRYIDERGAYKEDDPTAPGGRKFDLINPKTGDVIPLRKNRGWAFDQETFDNMVGEGRISFVNSTHIMVRRYLHETAKVTPQSVFYQPARSASERLEKYLNGKIFDFPKDEFTIQSLIEMALQEESGLVLDFFAGSGSTAHSALLEARETQTKVRYILVQLPEPVDPKSIAAESGFTNIWSCPVKVEGLHLA